MVCKISKKNGNNTFVIDGKEYLPIAFRSFRPTPANISLFYRNGVRLFQMQVCGINNRLNIPYSLFGGAWIGDHKYDFSVVDKQMEMFIKFAPNGYFMIMPVLDMPEWWRKENNCDIYSFYQLTEASFEEKWINDASDYLVALLSYCEEKYGNKIFAYSLSAGRTTEWFDGSSAPSKRKMNNFRQHVCDETLQNITNDDIKDKSLPLLYKKDSPMFLYNRYNATITPNLILRFAQVAQSVIKHNKPIGIFYGYSSLPTGWINQTAITGYEKVWQSEDIDMFFSPAQYYKARLINGVSTYQSAVNSIEANGKMYLHEIDHRTHLARYPMESGQIMHTDYETAEETIRILRRELCAVLNKDCAVWWFDMMGGYYASPEYETEISKQVNIINQFAQIPHKSVSEIAVFVDPLSFNYMKDESPITVDLVMNNIGTLNECGSPYDYFNLKDIGKIDLTQYKAFVFINALEISDNIKNFIKNNLAGKSKIWIYAPNLYSGGIEEICSIKTENYDNADAKIIFEDEKFGFTSSTLPMFYVNDDCEILAKYEDGKIACARKNDNVYIATGNVTPSLWRKIFQDAGVHIYAYGGGTLYADNRFIARQTALETDIKIYMPFDCELLEMFENRTYFTKNKILSYSCDNFATKLFMIKKKL